MEKIIVVNNGSTSKRYSLYEGKSQVYFAYYEKTPEGYLLTEDISGERKEKEIGEIKFGDSFDDFIQSLLSYGLIMTEDDINAVALRVVAPGNFFQEHKIIEEKYLEKIDDIYEYSPLHIKPLKESIAFVKDRLPGIKLIGVSDSAFHKTLPKEARFYGIPKDVSERLEIYRFGYHGISISSIVQELKRKNKLPENLIVCHLGGGSSITALKNGVSIDTSMGYSPLEGIVMATRSGNIDANALVAIIDDNDFDSKELQDFLYHKCGVGGVSGISNDTRVLLIEANKGNKDADFALDFYAYQIKKQIGAYATILKNVDMVVFTGKIGERSAEVRRRICTDLDFWGIKLDYSKNKIQIQGDGCISASESKIKVEVIESREVDEMARIAFDLV